MEFLKDIALHDKNTFHIGGNACYYAEPCSNPDLITAIQFAEAKKLPVFILGKGSNILISDDGWPGLVINLTNGFNKINWNSDGVEAESGVLLNSLIVSVIENGFGGMEELAGIPGTVGGAVIMNAGAFDTCVADTLSWVRYYDFSKGNIIESDAADLGLGYRTSSLKGGQKIILSAKFQFSCKSTKESLYSIRRNILDKRKMKQPLEYPNCGSVFKRPSGGYAGTLIEQCGLKGLRVGDAEVSAKHANFIVNRGNGTAKDVRMLIKNIQIAVFERFGVILEPEVIFVGEFKEPLLEINRITGEK